MTMLMIWINLKEDACPRSWPKRTLNSFLSCYSSLTKSLLLPCFCFPIQGSSLLQHTVQGYLEEGKRRKYLQHALCLLGLVDIWNTIQYLF